MNFTPKRAEAQPEVSKGATLITEYMSPDLITFKPEQSIEEAMRILVKKQISGAPVVDDQGLLVGMLSEKDCLHIVLESRYLNFPASQGKVSDYMSKIVTTISANKDVFDVATMFLNSNFRRYPVVDNGRLIGQVSRRDVLKAAISIKATTW